MYFAHSSRSQDRSTWQPLAEHLRNVAAGAGKLCLAARPGDSELAATAACAGLLHDLGKYRRGFQLMLEFSAAGKCPPVGREETYHKQAGAAKAFDANNLPIAMAICGHHGGMPDLAGMQSAVSGDHGRIVADAVWSDAIADCSALAALTIPLAPIRSDAAGRLRGELLTRILFSCLVDADWSDTAEHERKCRQWPADCRPSSMESWTRLAMKKPACAGTQAG